MSIARLALDYDDPTAVAAWSPRDRGRIVTPVPVVVTNQEVEYRRLLGPAIVQLRAIAGISQAQLAERIGRSEAAVSRWETGKATPSAWDLREIARVASLDDDQLDVLVRPPKGPISPVAERLSRANEAGARKGRAVAAHRPANGRGA
jgi:transcriptional regulator with XRE-family HTH domain